MSNNKIYYDVMSLNELETAKPHSKMFWNTIINIETIPKLNYFG